MILQQTIPTRSLGFCESIKICFTKFCNCQGRARRSEFWYFFLLLNIIIFMFYFVIIFLAVGVYSHSGPGTGFFITLALFFISLFIMFIPLISVSIRRLHDTGKSGAYLLLSFIPFCGYFIILVFLCQDSDQMDNIYGSSPKYTTIQNASLIDNPTNVVYYVSPYQTQPQDQVQPQYQVQQIQPQYQAQTQYQVQQQPLYQTQQYPYNQPQYQNNQPQNQIGQNQYQNNQNPQEIIRTPTEQEISEAPAPVNLPSEDDLVPKPGAPPY